MSASLGKHRDEILKHLNTLLKKNKIRSVSHEGKIFYEPEIKLRARGLFERKPDSF